jgi:hypothetical protein
MTAVWHYRMRHRARQLVAVRASGWPALLLSRSLLIDEVPIMGLLPVAEAVPGEDDRLMWRSISSTSEPVEANCQDDLPKALTRRRGP